MADTQVHTFQRGFGIGITSNWSVNDEDQARIVLSAYGHEVHIQPFEIINGQASSISLPRVKQEDIGQGDFHAAASDFDAFMFPEKAVWFGCLVAVQKAETPIPLSSITCSEQDNVWTVRTDVGPSIRLFQHVSGEVTELYEDDWRTVPLLESRIQTLWPGELTRRAAHEE